MKMEEATNEQYIFFHITIYLFNGSNVFLKDICTFIQQRFSTKSIYN